ncbi:MAG TPA: hypothetical protein DDY31_03095 [Lachnospiraceae bacterium]|nr:hypothetical protein [Lachnospiraceae bacterium]
MDSKEMDEIDVLVSVIIPVFNVSGYIEECLESVVRQTYTNLEILLMEGKSDDDSLDICVKWAKSDSRISLVSRKDGGLGPARNFGIDMAKGEYIFFVDSDDSLPVDAIETLVNMMQQDERIDIAAGSYCSMDESGMGSGCTNLLFEGCDSEIESKEQKERYIRLGVPAAWGKLYRTELWKRTGIRMPSVLAEDSAVFPSLVIMSNKIVCTDNITYCYRKRADSLFVCTHRHLKIYFFIYSYCDYLKGKGLFEEYRNTLFRFTYIHLMAWRDRLKPLIPDIEEYKRKVEVPFSNAVQECFGVPLISDRHILSIGSYNLRFICHRIHPQKGDIHTAFTTTVSQFYNFRVVDEKLYHFNSFRQMSLVNDREKKVYHDLLNLDSSIQLILIDFLDDVKDIAVLEDGGILTISEPFLEADKKDIKINHIVSWNSDEYKKMWEKSCNNFIGLLENLQCNVALVQSRYCNKYFDGAYHKFPDTLEIDKKNRFIEEMEKYFIHNISRKITVITIQDTLRVSDADFRYGCSPEYLCNGGLNEMADSICNRFEL